MSQLAAQLATVQRYIRTFRRDGTASAICHETKNRVLHVLSITVKELTREIEGRDAETLDLIQIRHALTVSREVRQIVTRACRTAELLEMLVRLTDAVIILSAAEETIFRAVYAEHNAQIAGNAR